MDTHEQPVSHPFRIDGAPRGATAFLTTPCRAMAEHLLGVRRLARLYNSIGHTADAREFVARCLDFLDIDCDVPPGDVDRIPAEGPAVVVANHPFGAAEGLLLLHILLTVRADVRVLANDVLGRLPALRDVLLLVDVFARDGSIARNGRPVRDALRWLETGGLLVVFPAGEVAHRRRCEREVTESAWQPTVARLLRRTKAPAVPLFFGGQNGTTFQLAGRVHPLLRTALLPRALLRQRGTVVPVRIGNPVPAEVCERIPDDRELAAYLRLRTLILGRRLARDAAAGTRRAPRTRPEPIARPVDRERLAADVAGLPPSARMATSGGLDALLARASQIPSVLNEIGRLRELSFRAVGEGTGRAFDLDRHDADYLHLFLWDPAAQEIVGAYRLGATDELIARGGAGALYTSSLFRFDPRFVRHVTPGLELGRSFVVPHRQRTQLPLLLLWRGVGAFVARNPRYRRLFGPVSISADYQGASRELLVDHLRTHEFLPHFAEWVRPRRQVRGGVLRRFGLSATPAMLRDLDDVSEMVLEIENGNKGVPVLVREYLKLGGKIIGFNVDPAFGEVVDGLVLVDLADAPPRRLLRIFGKEVAEQVLAGLQEDLVA